MLILSLRYSLFLNRNIRVSKKFACVSKDTEILTKNGFINFVDLTFEDEVATLYEDKKLDMDEWLIFLGIWYTKGFINSYFYNYYYNKPIINNCLNIWIDKD